MERDATGCTRACSKLPYRSLSNGLAQAAQQQQTDADTGRLANNGAVQAVHGAVDQLIVLLSAGTHASETQTQARTVLDYL
jgi:hypothetical protein